MTRGGGRLPVALALAALAAALFAPAATHPFVMYDDGVYVVHNVHVRNGLTLDGARWALTSGEESNWHPLTWLSHMLDVELFGLDPGAHHLVNVGLHALDTALLFVLFLRLTGRAGPSTFVAAVFAVHPLHVESVAWVAERKDVLCTLFVLLAMHGYADWVRRGGAWRYAGVIAAFVCALMSKPMAVTLPLLLLVLDLWPLGRLATWRALVARIVEKLPLFALAAAASAVTFVVQRNGGALALLGPVALPLRLENAVVSYATYLRQAFWPRGLAVIYPFPEHGLAPPAVIGALALFAALSAVAVLNVRRRPWLAAGWLWFVTGLLPVIGLVQVGAQSHADRYTYLPLAGIAVAVAWQAAELARPRAVAVAGTVAVAALAVLASLQLSTWSSNLALFGNALAVTRENVIAHHNEGVALYDAGRYEEAAAQLHEALRLRPHWSEAYKFHHSLARCLAKLGRADEAAAEYRAAIALRPHDPQLEAELRQVR